MSDYPMLISNKLHSFRNFKIQNYNLFKLQMQVHHSMTDYKSLIE